jgi:hypothetical protein
MPSVRGRQRFAQPYGDHLQDLLDFSVERMQHSAHGGGLDNSYLRIGRRGNQGRKLVANCREIIESQPDFDRKIT